MLSSKLTRTCQAHATQPPHVARSSLPHQQSPPVIKDHCYGFFPPHSTQPTTTLVPPPALIRTPSPVQSISLVPSTPENMSLQLHVTPDDEEVSDSGSGDEVSALQPEINEQSNDEDEHQAHTLLCAAPSSSIATLVQQVSSTGTHHGDHSFAVCISILIP